MSDPNEAYKLQLAFLLGKNRLFILLDQYENKYRLVWRGPHSNQLGAIDSSDYVPFNPYSDSEEEASESVDSPSNEWWPINFQFRENSLFYKVYPQQSLHVAILKRNAEVVRFLLEETSTNVNEVNDQGMTPLHFACLLRSKATVALLLHKGAELNKTNERGITALHFACLKGDEEIVAFLLEKGAQVDQATPSGLVTPLQLASMKGNHKALKLLLDKGANLKHTNDRGMSALHLACLSGDEESVTLLITADAALNQSTDNNIIPLHLACLKGDSRLVALLIKKAARVNERIEGGMTTLHLACLSGNTATVQVLLENGVEVNAFTNSGLTALHIASLDNHKEIVALLLKNGADRKKRLNAEMDGGVRACDLTTNNEIINLFYGNIYEDESELAPPSYFFQPCAANVPLIQEFSRQRITIDE